MKHSVFLNFRNPIMFKVFQRSKYSQRLYRRQSKRIRSTLWFHSKQTLLERIKEMNAGQCFFLKMRKQNFKDTKLKQLNIRPQKKGEKWDGLYVYRVGRIPYREVGDLKRYVRLVRLHQNSQSAIGVYLVHCFSVLN